MKQLRKLSKDATISKACYLSAMHPRNLFVYEKNDRFVIRLYLNEKNGHAICFISGGSIVFEYPA